eukprot:TRINITY_DN58193_c0_g1_i1.p1 TRINITY_DN58193_c0_g1~~TRINITY_DN58193_c0_g1_i1.p1  ORF type:complete len:150 (-),score=23.86 TRINITY_DN58193_c0_g1_i1:23-472(-)
MQATWTLIGAVLCVGAMLLLLSMCLYVTQIFTFLPGWGPVRKFDMYREDVSAMHLPAPSSAEAVQPTKEYGTLGPSTWGKLQAPWERKETTWHPTYGEVVLRPGFCDTRFLREHSSFWGRDELHYWKEAGIHQPPLQINEAFVGSQRMV